MTQKTSKIFIDEIYSKPSKKNISLNKTDFHHIDDIWSFDILVLKENSPENNRGHRYILVVIDNFTEFGWTVPLKNENSQIKNDF